MQPPAPFDPTALAEADLLRVAVEDSDFRRAQAAARELARRPDLDLAPVLARFAQALRHPEATRQRRAAQALAILGERAAPVAAALIEAAGDPRWTVREAAVQALGLVAGGSEAAREALVSAALHDRVPLVRSAAAGALPRPASPATVAALCHGLQHAFPRVRCRALQALAR